MRPLPQNLEPHLKAALDDMRSAILQLQQPGQPQGLFATTNANLPPGASYKNCRCILTDKNCIAISTEVAGTWEWLRADGSAI